MPRSHIRAVMVALVTIGYLAVWPREAAAQFPIPIGYGEWISHVGSIKDATLVKAFDERLKPDTSAFAAAPRPLGVGFKYRYVMLGLPLWTWGGSYCVYRGSRFITIDKSIAATLMGIREADVGAPFFYRFPVGWVGLIVLVVGARLMYNANVRSRRRAEAAYAASFETARIGSSATGRGGIFRENPK